MRRIKEVLLRELARVVSCDGSRQYIAGSKGEFGWLKADPDFDFSAVMSGTPHWFSEG